MRSMWQRVLHDNGGWIQFIPAAISAGKTIFDMTGGADTPESHLAKWDIPDFEEDPDYRKMQDYLKELGIDILGGDIPEYYSGIGEPGGDEFEQYLNLMTGDIKKSALETSAAIGRGGGRATEIASKNVGEFSTKARFADFMRALEGKKWLFGKGKDITEGVRGAGQTQQAQKNTYGLKKAGMEADVGGYLDKYDANIDAMLGDLFSKDISMTAGAISGAAGKTGMEGILGGIEGATGVDFDLEEIFKKAVPVPETTGTPKSKKLNLGQIGSSQFNIDQVLVDMFRA